MNIRNFLKSFLYEIASWVIFVFARFCYLTSRKEFINKELFDSVADKGVPIIYTCWHGRLFIVPHIRPKDKDVDCIVSNNKDGEIIARVLKKCGFGAIRGSANKTKKEGVLFTKDKGGMQVIRSGVKALRLGTSLGLTPDGPRGPANKFKSNALNMAMLSGAKILTFSFSSTNPFVFNSWDKFMIPLPFSKIVIIFGEFFEVERNLSKEDLEKCSSKIENNLNKITVKADNMCGV